MIRYGFLFTGVGLLDLGIEMAFRDVDIPLSCAWQVEINPFCRAVLAKHWPEVTRYEDVTRVGTTGHALAPVDLIVGGFPCQDVSLAGKGLGVRGGERSWLWFEYLRIIREQKPRAVIIENVAGLIRRGLDDVIDGLTEAGFAVEATRIQASDLGAPHRRERIFIVAYAARKRQPKPCRDDYELRPDHESDRSGLRPRIEGENREDAQPGMGGGTYGRPSWLDGHRWPAPPGPQADWEPPRTKAEVPNRQARLKALGNANVPACAYIAARRAIEVTGWMAP